MPIPGVVQPEIIPIDEELRLRKYDGNFLTAKPWYEDTETLMLVNGNDTPYTPERLKKMYDYLEAHGEEYFIELKIDGVFTPVGDVTFWQEDMPIVIGNRSCRGKGVGKRVVLALLDRARALGYDHLCVEEIYSYNTASQRLFESCGFQKDQPTEHGSSYICVLSA